MTWNAKPKNNRKLVGQSARKHLIVGSFQAPKDVCDVRACLLVWKIFGGRQPAASTVVLPRVKSILFRSLSQFFLMEAVLYGLSPVPEKSPWSVSNTALPEFCPQHALPVPIANSKLRFKKLSNAANITS